MFRARINLNLFIWVSRQPRAGAAQAFSSLTVIGIFESVFVVIFSDKEESIIKSNFHDYTVALHISFLRSSFVPFPKHGCCGNRGGVRFCEAFVLIQDININKLRSVDYIIRLQVDKSYIYF